MEKQADVGSAAGALPSVEYGEMDPAALKPHPRNYNKHPEEQIAHIMRSIEENGFFAPVVIARDNTILAGHGRVEAARRLRMPSIPTIRLDVNPHDPRALRVVLADNEIARGSERDDNALVDLLKEVAPLGLLGVGYDAQSVAALVYTIRPMSDVVDLDEAAHLAGLGGPDFDPGAPRYLLSIHFRNAEDRDRFVAEHKITIYRRARAYAAQNKTQHWVAWWPVRPDEDVGSVRWEAR